MCLAHNVRRLFKLSEGATGWLQEVSGGFFGNHPSQGGAPLRVSRSLDTQLGGGLFDTLAALDVLAAGLVITEDASHSAPKHRVLPELELRLFLEGDDPLNKFGFDQANPTADFLIAFTETEGENIKLLDWTMPEFGELDIASFYLQVWNSTPLIGSHFPDNKMLYGLVITVIPEPGTGLILVVFALVRRRPSGKSAGR